jgi:archaellum component FlaG (FlaF/FlaG flagellin family)
MVGDTLEFSISNLSSSAISYELSLSGGDLQNSDISGNALTATVSFGLTELSFNIVESCSGDIIFTLSGDNVFTQKNYQVVPGYNVQTTVSGGTTVLIVQKPGDTTLYEQLSDTFASNSKTYFNLSHPSMTSKDFIFETSTTKTRVDSNTVNVTMTSYGIPGRTGAKLLLEIDRAYTETLEYSLFVYVPPVIQREFDVSLTLPTVFPQVAYLTNWRNQVVPQLPSDFEFGFSGQTSDYNFPLQYENNRWHKILQRFKYYHVDKYYYFFLKHYDDTDSNSRFMFTLVPEDTLYNSVNTDILRHLSYDYKQTVNWDWGDNYGPYSSLIDDYHIKSVVPSTFSNGGTYNFTFERLRPFVHFLLNVDISNSGYDYIATDIEPVIYKNDGSYGSISDIAFTRLDTQRTGIHEIFQAASFLNDSMLVLNNSTQFWYIDMPLTFTMWVKADYSTNDTCLFIISENDDVNSVDGYVLSKTDNGDGTTYSIKHNDSITTDVSFNYDTWYHIGITFIRKNIGSSDSNDPGDFEMFVDGSAVTVDSGTAVFKLNSITSPPPGEFGTGTAGSQTHPVKKIVVGGGYGLNSWEGNVNDVRIYPTKLIPIEIGFVKDDIHVEGDDFRM